MNEEKKSSFKSIVNQLEDLKKFLPPINAAGYPFIILFVLFAFFLSLISDFLGWIGFVLTLWCVYFFRDPERVIPEKKIYLFHRLMVNFYLLAHQKAQRI